MGSKQAKSIRTLFLRRQVAVSLIVLGIITIILSVSLLALANYMDHRRILELSHSIESQSRIAKSPKHLQHAITQIVHGKRARGIVIFSGSGTKILAANGLPPSMTGGSWIVADKKIRQLVEKSLTTGNFGVQIYDTGNRRVSILPLAPPIQEAKGNNVILGAKWPTPAWHRKVALPAFSIQNIWYELRAVFKSTRPQDFHLPYYQYSGAVVVETSRDWITGLVLRSAFVIAALMILGIFAVVFALSQVLRKNVLHPISKIITVIAARRGGNHKARVPVSNIKELDDLADQWNSLLDFRDVAQGQNMILSTLLEHVPVGIDVTDANSRIEYANPSFLKMTGYSLAEVIGKTPETFLSSNEMDHSVLGDNLVAITNGKPWSGEMVNTRKDGSDLICKTTSVPIFNRDGEVERIISVRLDITDLKRDERSLISAKNNAEAADRAKSEFLSNMSHELRTPLNAIIGFSELMASQKLGPIENDEYVEFSKLIETSSRTLLTSINLILDLSRLDAKHLQLNETEFCVSELLHKIIESKTEPANLHGVELKRNLNCQHRICADEGLLRQALGYLISNAIRYNREGGEVSVSVKEANNEVTVSIADTGIGISQENLAKITEPFYRVDSALDRSKNGTGLGLTLVKRFAAEQKIDFNISSKLDEGTIVSLTFPIAGIQRHPQQKELVTVGLH